MPSQPGSQFEDSLQHHDFFEDGKGHLTYARCESCMYGSHFDTVTWHSWAGAEDLDWATEKGGDVDAIKAQKCACDCAGPRGATPEGNKDA